MNREDICCDAFLKFAIRFNWFSTEKDGEKILVMPNLEIEGVPYRINNCPSCGKECRSIELNPELLK